jgi:Leucine-rich repeat (LRR) protein
LIPPSSKLETLIANNCTLHQLSLSNAPLLQTLSLQHNQLKNVDFLNHPNNHQLQKVHIDHNQITSLPQLPPNLKIITASFNLLDDIESVALDIKNCKQLQEIDFTFNPIRKISSYKVQILSSLLHLKKIDGIKVTKIDL